LYFNEKINKANTRKSDPQSAFLALSVMKLSQFIGGGSAWELTDNKVFAMHVKAKLFFSIGCGFKN